MAGSQGVKVLVVDDQEGVRLLLQEMLVADGLRVATAGNGQEALAQVEADPPDLVLLDLKMPGMTGLEVLQSYRRGRYLGPVIVMTAYHGEDELQVRAMLAGVQGVITKPFDLETLRALVKDVLATKGLLT